LISGAFAAQAAYQADLLNLSDVRVSFVRHPISDAPHAAIVSKAEESYDAVVRAISTDAPAQAPAWLRDAAQGCSS